MRHTVDEMVASAWAARQAASAAALTAEYAISSPTVGPKHGRAKHGRHIDRNCDAGVTERTFGATQV